MLTFEWPQPGPLTFDLVKDGIDSLPRIGSQREILNRRLQEASSHQQWEEAALILDELDGRDAWKYCDESPDYDYILLRERLASLRAARESGDVAYMIFQLRTSLTRNLANIGSLKMYEHCRTGTKRLIEEYMNEVIHQLDILCQTPSEDVDDATKLEFLTTTRQSFGRTALLLSGGATLGMHHIGVAQALHETKMLPRIISGASVGSIVAAMICVKTDGETDAAFANAVDADLEVFSSNGDTMYTLVRWFTRFVTHGHLIDSSHLKRAMQRNVGDLTFAEAYNRTRRILNITVSSSTQSEQTKLLNYVTAPNVLIWSAVCASCAVPLVFAPVGLLAKDANGKIQPWKPADHCYWIDGSVQSDLPMDRLSELFNVNHFIVSQVNPHVVPFLAKSVTGNLVTRCYRTMLSLARLESMQRISQMIDVGLFPSTLSKLQAVISQRYRGDITIIPEADAVDMIAMLQNPTKDFMLKAMSRGKRATFPKIAIIRNHCAIELFLDDVLYRMRLAMLQNKLEVSSSPFTSWNTVEGGLRRKTSMPDLNAVKAWNWAPLTDGPRQRTLTS